VDFGLYDPKDQKLTTENGLTVFYRKSGFCEPVSCEIYFIVNGEKIIRISSFGNKVTNQHEIFQQLLSTFKLTDQNNVTSNPNETKLFSSNYISFQYPTTWNPTPQQLFGGMVIESLKFNIPGITSDNSIGFSSPEYSSIQINDATSQTPIKIGGKSGTKYVRKTTANGVTTYSYDYLTTGYNNSGTFSVHVNTPTLNPTLEKQLDDLVETIVFK